MIKIANAFSINMLDQFPCDVRFQEVDKDYVLNLIQQNNNEIDLYIGHENTTRVLSSESSINIPVKRQPLTLKSNEYILVAQLTRNRLPEGATKLHNNFRFRYFLVNMLEH